MTFPFKTTSRHWAGIVPKNWLYSQGGRPVIYQPDREFEMLPESHRWRHVRYEPGAVDFTWEREWRIQTDRLSIDPSIALILVASHEWAESLIDLHDQMIRRNIEAYSTIFNNDEAELLFREQFEWQVMTLT